MADASKINKDIKVLVVDDHPLTRNMVRSILRGAGFDDVLQAENGAQALEVVFKENLGLVICDWNMPTTSGIEVLRAIRAEPKLKSLPFLMLTAEAYRENVLEASKAGVTDYVVKPFTADVLMKKVEEVLKKVRS